MLCSGNPGTITVQSRDADAVKATVKVKVNALFAEEKEYTITEKNGLTIELTCWGSSSDQIKIDNNAKKFLSVKSCKYSKLTGKLTIELSPIKAGRGNIKITEKNSKESITLTINVASSSVYDAISYPELKYSATLRNIKSFIGNKCSFRGEVRNKFTDDTGTLYVVGTAPKGYWYEDKVEVIAIDGITDIPTRILEDDIVTVYGTIMSDESSLENVFTKKKDDTITVFAEKIIVH